MARIAWNELGERYFESGVDRGVFYPLDAPGVAWAGLISVSEGSSGGSPTPFYFDGVKVRNLSSEEDFEASITALSAPLEFEEHVGTKSLAPGLFATHQPRKQFNLSYRTLVGNDEISTDFGYKIHLVYNALATPGSVSYKTLSNNSDPTEKSWVLSTVPVEVVNARPAAHFVIDTRYISAGNLSDIEDVLYGTSSSNPEFPTVAELVTILS